MANCGKNIGQSQTTEPFGAEDRIPKDEANMEDFPIWLKAVIYLIVGAVVVYIVVAGLYALFAN